MVDEELKKMQDSARRAMKRIPQSADFALRQAAGYLHHGTCMVCIDPGASTGWFVSNAAGGFSEHGQDPPAVAAKRVLEWCNEDPIGLLVVEEPFLISTGNQWKLAWVAGEMFGRLAGELVDDRAVWTPKPISWRAVINLGRGKRDEVNAAIHTFAEDQLQVPLRTPSGQPEYDRANAIGMSVATRLLLNQIATEKKEQKR